MNLRIRVATVTVIIFAALVYLFAWSSAFSVKSVEVRGLPIGVSPSTIVSKAHIKIGEKLARIEPRAVENNLGELSWVKSISVDRNWINGKVLLVIKSRVAVGNFQGQVIDSTGTLFDLPGKAPSGLPTVSASSTELGLEAISLFTALPEDIKSSLISMNARNQSSISSLQNNSGVPIKVMWGNSNQLSLKVSVYRALLALPENKNLKRMDLSAPHAPIVK